MRYLIALSAVFLVSGCSGNRTITYVYYPNVQSTREFPQLAKQECAKYGQTATLYGFGANGTDSYGRVTQTYICDWNRGTLHTPFGG